MKRTRVYEVNYLNKTVTVGYNEETEEVVVIG